MNKNLIQVKIFYEKCDKLNHAINQFLVEQKISRTELLDIKFCTDHDHRFAMIVYEVNMEEKK